MKHRAGFSLITVLIITIMSLAMMGSIIYVSATTAGSTRIDIAQADAFNIMQSGVEQAKAVLAAESRGVMRPLACTYEEMTSYTIESLDSLLIRRQEDGEAVGRVISDDEISIGGRKYSYTVSIYDMRYTGATIDAGDADSTLALKAEIPQLMAFTVYRADSNDPNVLAPNEGDVEREGAGIYLIRAVLTPKDSSGAPRVVETAVVQALDAE